MGALLLCYFLLQHLACLREYREALPCENESVEAFLAAHPLRRKVRVLDRLSSPLTYDEQVLLRCGLSSRASYARELIRLEERKPAFLPLKHISVKTKPKKGFVRL